MLSKKPIVIATLFALILLLSVSATTNINDPFPHIQKIQYKVYDDTAQMNAALLVDHEIDMRPGPGTTELIDACVAAGYNMTFDPISAFGFMAVQNRDEYCAHVVGGPAGRTPGETCKPLNDSRFRVALSYVWGMDDKADAIYEYYQNSLTVALGSAIMPAQGGWCNNVDVMPDTDNDTAWQILMDADYTLGAGDDAGYLLNPDGSRVRDLEVVYSTGTLSWEYILQQFVGQVNAFFDSKGATNGPNFILTDREFMTLVYELMDFHDFDFIGIGLTGLGLTPDWCFDNYHSSTIGPWQWNFGGFVNDTMDDLLETMMYNLDEATVLDAVWEMQRLFVSDWMPLFPVTTGQGITTWDPDLDNFIGSPGPGADQCYLNWRSVHWGPGTVYNNPPYEGLIRRAMGDEPDTLSPWTDNTLYGWLLLDGLHEPLMMFSPPVPSTDLPWIAYKSKIEAVNSTVNADVSAALNIPDGMKVTYYLRNDVYWQDTGAGGKTFQFTADDCQFAFNMLKKWEVGRYESTWKTVVYTEAKGPYEFITYFNATSLWYEDYPQIASYFPKHIYYILDEMAEQSSVNPDEQKIAFDAMVPDAWDYQDWTAKAKELWYTSVRPQYLDYYAAWPDAGLPPRDSNAPQTANVGAGAFVYDYYDDATRIGEVHSSDVYWVDGPIKAVVDAPYIAFVNETDCVEDPVEYNVLVTNYGYKVDGELANKTVDVVIKEDGVVKHVENDTQVNVFDWATLGPYTIYPLCAGTVEITVEVWQGTLLVDTYTHTIHATIPEDINIDDKVRVDDVLAAALAFGSDPLSAFLRWDPRCDVNGDFKIRVDDILAVALNFGWP